MARSAETLTKEISKRFSRHLPFGDGDEAYDFGIKMQTVEIPGSVRLRIPPAEINERFESEASERLTAVVRHLKETYPWITKWAQTGRSGGWLTLITETPALSPAGTGVDDMRLARRRLRDLMEIEDLIFDERRRLRADLESTEWWGGGPHEWSPRRTS